MSELTPAPGSLPLQNPKHEAVLCAWIADAARVWWKAYQSVYPKSQQHAAETAASRLLKGAEFCARRDWLLKQISDGVVSAKIMDLNETLEELSKLGRSSIKKAIVDGDNTADVVTSLREMPDDVAATIKSLTIETYVEGAGDDARDVKKLKIELHDKRGALHELRSHHEPQRHEHTGANGEPIKTEDVTEPRSDLDVARRIAFLLELGKRQLDKKGAAAAAKPKKPKKKRAAPAAAPTPAAPAKEGD